MFEKKKRWMCGIFRQTTLSDSDATIFRTFANSDVLHSNIVKNVLFGLSIVTGYSQKFIKGDAMFAKEAPGWNFWTSSLKKKQQKKRLLQVQPHL